MIKKLLTDVYIGVCLFLLLSIHHANHILDFRFFTHLKKSSYIFCLTKKNCIYKEVPFISHSTLRRPLSHVTLSLGMAGGMPFIALKYTSPIIRQAANNFLAQSELMRSLVVRCPSILLFFYLSFH